MSVHDKSNRSIRKVVIQLGQPGCRSTLFENLSTKSTVGALGMSTQTINRSSTSNLQNQSATNLYRKSPHGFHKVMLYCKSICSTSAYISLWETLFYSVEETLVTLTAQRKLRHYVLRKVTVISLYHPCLIRTNGHQNVHMAKTFCHCFYNQS